MKARSRAKLTALVLAFSILFSLCPGITPAEAAETEPQPTATEPPITQTDPSPTETDSPGEPTVLPSISAGEIEFVEPGISINSTPTLTDTSKNLYVGDDDVINVRNATGTVTWSSSNPSVATVNGGTINGIAPGYAKITASVAGYGNLYCHVYVNLNSGVYRINHVSSGLVLGFANSSTTASLQQADSSNPRRLFQVISLEWGEYMIKPLHEPNYVLTAQGSTIDYQFYGASISGDNLELTQIWYIDKSSNGLEISNAEYGERIIPSGGGVSVNTTIVVSDTLNVPAQSYLWTLTPDTLTAPTLQFHTTERYLEVGNDYPLGIDDIPNVTYTSSDPSIVTVDNDGYLWGVSVGTATITASAPGYVSAQCVVHVVLQDGIYTLWNDYDSGNLSFDTCNIDGTSNGRIWYYSSTSNNVLQLTQYWQITHIGSGYYSLRPWHNLNAALYADVSANRVRLDFHTSDTDLPTNYKWRIINIDGSYAIQSVINSKVMCTNTSNYDVVLRTYSTADDDNYWYIETADDPPDAVLLYNTNTGEMVGSSVTNELYTAEADTYQHLSLSQLNLSLYFCKSSSASPHIEWDSSNPSIATVTSSGSVNTFLNGVSNITATVIFDAKVFVIEYQLAVYRPFTIVHYYDKTIIYDDAINESMASAVEFINEHYRNLFYVRFTQTGGPSYFTNVAFTPNCTSNDNAPCSDHCGLNCLEHHKNVTNLSNQYMVDFPRDDNQINVFWSNAPEVYCSSKNGVHTTYTLSTLCAVVVSNRPIVHFCYIPQDKLMWDAYMSTILAHEITHSFGMRDVYNDDGHDFDGGYRCVMEKYEENKVMDYHRDIENGDAAAFCTPCFTELLRLLKPSAFDNDE